jgi:mannan endo-1,4-beta-mannosidase
LRNINNNTAILVTLLCLYSACKKAEIPVPVLTPVPTPLIVVQDTTQVKYNILGSKIQNVKTPIQLIGANNFHSFSASSSRDMLSWNMEISREFVGNMKENPLTGYPVKDSNGAWLHSLQAVVDSNRLGNRITIIGAFGWDGKTEFTGLMPTKTAFWAAYKAKIQEWAIQFKNQPDVWIEVWNEPYRWDRADGYTDDIWYSDMNEMVALIRNTGNKNIILVPCAEQGQDESVLINKGTAFLANKTNILFDIHAYEKWLLVSNTNMGSRLAQLQAKNFPLIFGETAPLNAGSLMNPQPFLDSTYNRGISICAWVWKNDENDTDALLTKTGLPNNNNNNNWGTLFKNLAARVRKP